jgi:hypothetical protein
MTTKGSNRRSATGRASALMFTCALLVGPAMGAASTTSDLPAATPAQWHAQKLEFNYAGFTAFYTCDGLESKVRDILLTFGARKDLKVRAIGCDRAQDQPNKTAWVQAEFSSLAPAAADASASDTVQAVWDKVQLAPNRPREMGMGECELVDQIRPMLEKGFNLRNASYQTSCVPKQISVADYNVKAEVLRLVAVAN